MRCWRTYVVTLRVITSLMSSGRLRHVARCAIWLKPDHMWLVMLTYFRIYQVVKYVSMTNHMWSGFNQLAHLATRRSLPEDIKAMITPNVTTTVRQQRIDQGNVNASLRDRFAAAGLIFNDVDQAPFRARLANVYATWKDKLGSKCWTLLEAEVGKLG